VFVILELKEPVSLGKISRLMRAFFPPLFVTVNCSLLCQFTAKKLLESTSYH